MVMGAGVGGQSVFEQKAGSGNQASGDSVWFVR